MSVEWREDELSLSPWDESLGSVFVPGLFHQAFTMSEDEASRSLEWVHDAPVVLSPTPLQKHTTREKRGRVANFRG